MNSRESSLLQFSCIINMHSPIRLIYVFFLVTFALFNLESLSGQGAFADQVDRDLGSMVITKHLSVRYICFNSFFS